MRTPTCVLHRVMVFALTLYSSQLNADTTESVSQEHVVEIRQFEFVPKTIQAKRGDTITWVNKDIVPHTATSNDSSWDTGLLKKDESSTLTVSAETASDYFCRFHVKMTGTVSVQNAANVAPAALPAAL